MNKRYLILFIILGIIIISVLLSWLGWLTETKKNMNIYILDKTVPLMERTEHESFNWILNYNKYVKPNGNLYQDDQDYYGFFPLNKKSREFDFKSIRIHEIEGMAEDCDMLYYADTYGVYYNEWYKKNSSDVQHTQKVYGGLNQNDYLLMKKMKEHGKLIIGEFNLYNAPTNGLIREKVEEMFGLKWSGWTGKYYSSLDTSKKTVIPKWIVNLYKEQNDDNWPYKNAGIALVHKFGTIIILEYGKHLNGKVPYIIANKNTVDYFKIPEKVHYPQWFDITYSTDKNEVLANFNLNVNAKGDSILREYKLKPVFPAVTEYKNDYTFYYFGGDFAENSIQNSTAFFKGYQFLASKLSGSDYSSTKKFYWKFYVPVMTKILEENFEKIKNK